MYCDEQYCMKLREVGGKVHCTKITFSLGRGAGKFDDPRERGEHFYHAKLI